MIKFDDFQKLDIRIGKITKVEKVENADKLYKLQVDIGDEKRQVIAGIADRFSESDLVDQLFPFVINLEPAKIRGLESQAMILVAEDKQKNLALLKPSKDLKPGSKIV
jgi:methionine--tRNA ligase beta chain